MKIHACPLCNGTGKVSRKNKGPKPKDIEERFWKKVDKRTVSECWEWLAFVNKSTGYGQFSNYLYNKNVAAHRVAYELSTGERLTADDYVCHRCDNRKCCNPSHLFKGDAAINAKDKVSKGRQFKPNQPKGFNSVNTKTTQDMVNLIRFEWNGRNAVTLAKKYKIGRTTVARIVYRQGMYKDV